MCSNPAASLPAIGYDDEVDDDDDGVCSDQHPALARAELHLVWVWVWVRAEVHIAASSSWLMSGD